MSSNRYLFYGKKILAVVYKYITDNIIVIVIIRKPINTWVLPNIKDRKIYDKDALIWTDERFHQTEWFSNISSQYENKFLSYLLENTHPKDSILDICCNQGRFIKALKRNKYNDLNGFDIMKKAVDILKNSDEFKDGGIHVEHALAQDYLADSKDNSYDYAITFGATIELIHPSFRIFDELYRITRKGFIFVLAENGHLYPRFYRMMIKSSGFQKKTILSLSPKHTLMHYVKK